MLPILQIIVWTIIGLFAAIPFVSYAKKLLIKPAAVFLGRCLIIAAFIYLVFAVIYGNYYWMGMEALGLAVYSGFYLLPKRSLLLWVGIGWLIHPLWDLGIHYFGPGDVYSPDWYVFVCLGFDLVIGLYAIRRWRHDRSIGVRRSFSRYESSRKKRQA